MDIADSRVTQEDVNKIARHPSTVSIMKYFEWKHLPEKLQPVSYSCAMLAEDMMRRIPDGPELTAGLRKLLEAKDCFVRASL